MSNPSGGTKRKAEDDDYERMLEEKREYNRKSSARSRLRTKERIADLVALSGQQAQKIAELEQVNSQLVEQLRLLTAEHQRLEQILQERSISLQRQSSAPNTNLQLLIESLAKKAILQSQIAAIHHDGRQTLPLTIAAKIPNDTSNHTVASPAVASGSLSPGDSILHTYNAFLMSLSQK
jgi:hypothetical protein